MVKGERFTKFSDRVSGLFQDEFDLSLDVTDLRRASWMRRNGHVSGETRDVRVALGRFYEILTRAMFGGDYADSPSFDFKKHLDVDPEMGRVGLDVISVGEERIFESKAWRRGQQFNLLDYQNGVYQDLVALNPNWNFGFVLYVHGFSSGEKVNVFRGSDSDLYKHLCEDTNCALVLPFEVTEALHSSRDRDLVSPYDGDEEAAYSKCNCVHANVSRDLLEKPGEVLEMLGLDSRSFSYTRSKFPEGKKFEGKEINPFFIIEIERISDDVDGVPF